MNKNQIALKYANAIVAPAVAVTETRADIAATFAAEVMQLGFMPTEELLAALSVTSKSDIETMFAEVIPELKKAVGADVEYNPMYPNFPAQVMEADLIELFLNAIIHYWTGGEWKPEYGKLPRDVAFEEVEFKPLGVVTDGPEFDRIFTRLITSNESLSNTDKQTILWFIDNREVNVDVEIPFKENLCFVAGALLERNHDITSYVSTATDVLRIATFLSGGDISLAENTKFKSQPRRVRRLLVNALEGVIREEDLNRHRGKFTRLFHSLHVGEFSQKVYQMAKKIRENEKIATFNGKVQKSIDNRKIKQTVELLVTRPGEFARRLDEVLRLSKRTQNSVVTAFLSVADKVPTRVLLQVLGHFNRRRETIDKRIVFPKGNAQRAQVVRGELEGLRSALVNKLVEGIENTLCDRFGDLEPLGKIWIDPDLALCPVPTQMRSASEGLKQVARGTRLPIGDKGTLRFFIYWVGQDIDLSATMHDENFNIIEHVSYTNLRSARYQACHSGDIVDARNGASEFIDIDIDSAVKYGARYVAMNVYVYAGPTFAQHDKVYAGWMTRDEVQSNEVYEPKTVQQKIDLTSESRNAVPVFFDLVERKAIWADMTSVTKTNYGGNNVESNRATIQQTIDAIVSLDSKVSLYDLFRLHGAARGDIVEARADADTVFAIDGDITPYDISVINSEYI